MARIEYVPLPPPQTPEALGLYLQNELQRIATIVGGISERYNTGLFIATPPATLAGVSTTPVILNIFDTVRADEDSISADETTGIITFDNEGRYTFNYSGSVESDANNTTVTIGVYISGTLLAGTEQDVFLKTASEPIPVGFTISGNVTKGQTLELRGNVASGTVTLSFGLFLIDVSGRFVGA